MEKIMNMQAQSGMPASSAIPRQARNRVQDTKDDFIRLLQQQNEPAGLPEKAENAKDTKDVKDAEKPEKKQPEEAVEEQVEETDGQEMLPDLTQMELQQSILQQAVIQIAEPAVTDQQITADAMPELTDGTTMEAVQETGELSMEASVLPEAQPVKPGSIKPEMKPESAKAVKTDVADVELKTGLVESEAPEHVEPLPQEDHQEASVTGQRPQNMQASAAEKRETVPDEEEPFQSRLTGGEVSQTASMQQSDAPVHAENVRNVPQPEFQEGEKTVRSTVEELPQELGKALTAGKAGNGQVLTVELEPVSLGKLTIRLEYEAGKTVVSVMASNPKTLELLSQKASEIATILKDHTGEETVIYTEQPQKEPGEEAQERQSHGGQQQERQQHRHEEQPQTDSFMQQLRLGLV